MPPPMIPDRVLILAAETPFVRLVTRVLTTHGLRLQRPPPQADLAEAALLESIDLIVLDLHLSSRPAPVLCRQIRQHTTIPLLVVGSPDDPQATVAALEVGADECLVPPLSEDELLARVRALLRRARWTDQAAPPVPVTCGSLVIDLHGQQVLRAGVSVRLNRKEWGVLAAMVRNAGQVLTHRMLLQRVWGDGYGEENNYLHSVVYRLRRKLEDDPAHPRYLLSEPRVGYRFARAECFEMA